MKQVRKLILLGLLVLGGFVLTGCAGDAPGKVGKIDNPFDQDPSQTAVDSVYVDKGQVEAQRTDEAMRDQNAAQRKLYEVQTQQAAAALAAQKERDASDKWLRDTTNTIGAAALALVVLGGCLVVLVYAGAGGVFLFGQARARSAMIMPNKRGEFPAFYDAKTGRLININLMTSPVLFANAFEHLSEQAQVAIYTALSHTRIARALADQKVHRTTATEERKMVRAPAIDEREERRIEDAWAKIEGANPNMQQPAQLAPPRGVMFNEDGSEVEFA